MVRDLSYAKISLVLHSWEKMRQSCCAQEDFGIEVLISLFELSPSAKVVFGFKEDAVVKATGMQKMALLIHGRKLVQMIDGTLVLLGPDVEMMEDFLGDLGGRHKKLGVKPEHFDALGDSLRKVMKENLGKDWRDDVDAAWKDVFTDMAAEIKKSM